MYKSDREIFVYSPPRTGSTYIWQILSALFGKKIGKSHVFPIHPEKYIVIATLRHPIDTICSWMRVHHVPFEYQGVERFYPEFQKHWNKMDESKTLSNFHCLRYELFQSNPNYLFHELERIFHIVIPTALRTSMAEKFSKEENRKIAKTIPKFSLFDPTSYIHGEHVSDTQKSWKELLPQTHHPSTLNLFHPQLTRFGYTP